MAKGIGENNYYDLLGGNLVQCFPISKITYCEGNLENPVELWQSSGHLRSFNIGDTVPWRTLYYNYGPNFMIFDYEGKELRKSEVLVHIIQDGKYLKSVKYMNIPNEVSIGLVLDVKGNVLNIKSREDFKTILSEYCSVQKQYINLCKKYGCIENPLDTGCVNGQKISMDKLLEAYKKYISLMEKAKNESIGLFESEWLNPLEKYLNIFDNTYIGSFLAAIFKGYKTNGDIYLSTNLYYDMKYKDKVAFESDLDNYLSWLNVVGYYKVFKRQIKSFFKRPCNQSIYKLRQRFKDLNLFEI